MPIDQIHGWPRWRDGRGACGWVESVVVISYLVYVTRRRRQSPSGAQSMLVREH